MFTSIGFFAPTDGGGGEAGSTAALAISKTRNVEETWTVLSSTGYIWYKMTGVQVSDLLYYSGNNAYGTSIEVYSDAGVTLYATLTLSGQYAGTQGLPDNGDCWFKFTRSAGNYDKNLTVRVGP